MPRTMVPIHRATVESGSRAMRAMPAAAPSRSIRSMPPALQAQRQGDGDEPPDHQPAPEHRVDHPGQRLRVEEVVGVRGDVAAEGQFGAHVHEEEGRDQGDEPGMAAAGRCACPPAGGAAGGLSGLGIRASQRVTGQHEGGVQPVGGDGVVGGGGEAVHDQRADEGADAEAEVEGVHVGGDVAAVQPHQQGVAADVHDPQGQTRSRKNTTISSQSAPSHGMVTVSRAMPSSEAARIRWPARRP